MRAVSPRRQGQRGFILLFIFLMAAVMALSIYRELPKVAFESQRLREELLIERGMEYRRAIQLFFRKKKQYPKDIDALEKDGNLRYLRRRYADPMTGKDEWRLIHIGPNGEFTDSLVLKKKNPLESEKKGNQNTFITEGPSIGAGPETGPGQATIANRVRQSDLAGAPGQGVPGQGMPTEGNPQQQGFYQPLQGGQPAGQPQQQVDPNNPNAGMMPQQQVPQQGFPVGFPQQQQQQGGTFGQQQPVGFPAQGQQFGQPPVGYPPAPGQTGFNPMSQVIPGMGTQGIQSRIPGYTQPSSSQTGGVVPQQYPNPYQQNPYQQQNPFQQPGFPGQQQNPYQQNSGAAPRGAFTANPAAAQQIMSMITQPRPGGAPAAAQQQMGSGFGAVGGGVAGVASKFEAEGIKIFGEKTKYNEWEFLYDFQRDEGRGTAGSGTQGASGLANPGNTVGGANSGFGNSTGGFGNSSGGLGNSSGGFGNSSGGFGTGSGSGFGNNPGMGSSPGFGTTPRR